MLKSLGRQSKINYFIVNPSRGDDKQIRGHNFLFLMIDAPMLIVNITAFILYYEVTKQDIHLLQLDSTANRFK